MPSVKRHNTRALVKAELRRKAVRDLGGQPFVYDLFCGSGTMYRAAYFGLRGVAVDRDQAKAAEQSRERAGWICLCGDAVNMAWSGFFAFRPGSLIDSDVFGSPWSIAEAVASRKPAGCILILTDGYAPQRNMGILPQQLGTGRVRGLTMAAYEQRCRSKLVEWFPGAVVRFFTTPSEQRKGVAQWVVAIPYADGHQAGPEDLPASPAP